MPPEEDEVEPEVEAIVEIDDDLLAEDEPIHDDEDRELIPEGEPDLSESEDIKFPIKPLVVRPKPEQLESPNTNLGDHISPEILPPLKDVLSDLRGRADKELIDWDARVAIASLLDADVLTDYRTRVVLPLRSGVYPLKFQKNNLSISRNGETISLKSIMDKVAELGGLDLETTSLLLGLTPKAILGVEDNFFKSYVKRYPALNQLAAHSKVSPGK